MLDNILSKAVYTASGTQRQWDIPFEFYKIEDVHIYITSDGEHIEEIDQNYYYDEDGKFFIYPTEESKLDPLPAGTRVLILRETKNTQEEDSSDIYFKSKDIERGLDKLTMQVQDLKRDSLRAVKLSHFATQTPEDFTKGIFEAEKRATEAAAKASLSEQNAASSESSAVQASASATASAELAQNAMDSSLENAERAENAAQNALASETASKNSEKISLNNAQSAEENANIASEKASLAFESAASALSHAENAEKAQLLAESAADRAENAAEKLQRVMLYKGSVSTFSDLPVINELGDVWNVSDTGANYAWDGEKWDKFSEIVDLKDYVKNTDFANVNTGGVIRSSSYYGTSIQNDGKMCGVNLSLDNYTTADKLAFISKGTLENAKNDIVKRGIVDNDITLTDTEKQKAKDWLGISGGGGSGGGSVPGNVYTEENLVPGKNIAFIKGGYHKILSNFSSSKYVKFLKKFPSASTYKMIVGLTTGSDVKTTQSILSVQGVDKNFYLKGSGSVFSYYTGSSVAGKTVATAKTDYWLVFDYDGTTCKLYSAKDDGTYVNPKDLPALTDSFWTEELSSTTEIFKGKNLQLGKNGSTTAYWFGSINLGKVLITADGEDWFNGLTAQEGVDFTNTGCTVTSERVEGLEVSTSVDSTIEKLSQLEDDLGVYTKTNLIGGNGITIEEQAAQGGIDENTIGLWDFETDRLDVLGNYTEIGYSNNAKVVTDAPKFGTGRLISGIVYKCSIADTQPFTLDLQYRIKNGKTFRFGLSRGQGGNGVDWSRENPNLYVEVVAGGSITLYANGWQEDKSVSIPTPSDWVNLTYAHLALTHDGKGSAGFWYNGQLLCEVSGFVPNGSTFRGISIDLPTPAYSSGTNEPGIDEIRLSNIVRYKKYFTPPAEAYTKGVSSGTFLINLKGGAGRGKSIGEVFYSQSDKATDNPGSLPLFTGETIASANTIYPDFYKWISERAELQITSDKYEEALANFGECPKYVLDIASTEETNSYKYTFQTTVPDTWVLAYLDNGEYVEFEENGVYYSPVKFAYNTSERSTNELYYDEGLTKRIFARDTSVSESWLPVSAFTMAASSDTNGWIALLGYFKDGFYTDFHDSTTLNSTTTISSTATPEESVVTRTTYTRDGSLRLPKLANYIKMANTTDGITQGEAGIPNITADFRLSKQDLRSANGALSLTGPGINTKYSADGASSSGNYGEATFSASNSSEVYGNSDTVTPAHTTLYPWVYAFSAAIPASVAQAAEFQDGLSGKADADLGNIPTNIDYVVERYDDEQGNWYEVWKSGRLRQGGKLNSSSSGNLSFVFLKPFADNKYTIATGVNSGDNYVKSVQLNTLTETGFNYKIATDGGGLTSQPCYYIAEGKGA